jgi:hypothetical protein
MPLLEMSPNVQEVEGARRKRTHDEYSLEDIVMDDVSSLKPSESNGAINPPNREYPLAQYPFHFSFSFLFPPTWDTN